MVWNHRYLATGLVALAVVLAGCGGGGGTATAGDDGDAANRTFYNVSAPAGSAGTAESPVFRDAGTVQTDDGPRERYVVDDPAQLGGNASQYDSVSIEVFVDPDTDLVTRYRFEGR